MLMRADRISLPRASMSCRSPTGQKRDDGLLVYNEQQLHPMFSQVIESLNRVTLISSRFNRVT